MSIDTLKVARRLREAGFTEPQAEAVVDAVRDGDENSDVATKHDSALLARRTGREMFSMIIGAVLVNIVAMPGVMFAFA